MYTCVYISNVLLAIYLPAFFIHIDTFSHKWDHIPYFQLHYLVILQLYGFSYLIKKRQNHRSAKVDSLNVSEVCYWLMHFLCTAANQWDAPQWGSQNSSQWPGVWWSLPDALCDSGPPTLPYTGDKMGLPGLILPLSNLEPGLDNVRIENIWV